MGVYYISYGIVLDVKGSWNFGNEFARNVVIFGVNFSSSSHSISHKNNFLVLGEGPTFDINGSVSSPEKKSSVNFVDANITFCLILHRNGDNSYLFVDGIEISKFKVDNENVNFPAHLCLGSISNGFGATESREVSLKGNVYDFSID